jgi:transcriptional regulator with XRE-family HTH domain
MPKKESVDAVTRGRIAAWLNYKMRRNRLTIAATAQLMGVSAAAVSRVSSGARTPGLDFVIAMSKALIIPLDVLITVDPPIAVEDGTRLLPAKG